jgi:4-amino-4-deoxy-L-arabinose transferase-like glycosyltransferase
MKHPLTWIQRALTWAVCFAGSSYILLFLGLTTLRLIYPYEVEWNEGAIFDHALRILHNKPIYTAPSLEFAAFIYTPLYYYMVAAVMKLTGVTLLAGRLISILSTLLTAFLVGRITHRETKSALLAFSSAALYIAFFHVTGFFYDLVRMDALAIFFAVAAIYTVLYSKKGYVSAAILIVLAYFTKQQMLCFLPAIALWLFIRNPKQAAIFIAVSVALLLGGSLILNMTTHGWFAFYTWKEPSAKTHNSFSYGRAFVFFHVDLLGTFALTTIVIIFAYILTTTLPRPSPLLRGGGKNLRYFPSPLTKGEQSKFPPPLSKGEGRGGVVAKDTTPPYEGHSCALLLFCYVASIAASSLSIGNEGGYKNVLMPLAATIAILFPISLLRITQSLSLSNGPVQWLLLFEFFALSYNPLGEKMLIASPRQRHAGDEFIAKLRTIPGDVWIPMHGYLNTLAGKSTFVHFMAMNDALTMQDTTAARLQREIDSAYSLHRFTAIILDQDLSFPPDSIPHYTLQGTIFRTPNVFLSRLGDEATRPQYLYVPSP